MPPASACAARRADSSAIQSILQDKRSSVMLRLLGAKGGIAALRPAGTPSERWWWYLDQYVAQRTRRDVRNLALTVLAVVVVIAVAAILYNTFVHPDPIVLARMDATNRAQNALQDNRLPGALKAIDDGLVKAPDDSDLLMWRGAILMLLQRTGEAQAAWSTARPAFASDADFLTQRGFIRLQAGDPAGASADSQDAIRLAPERPQPYLTLASAQEFDGDYPGRPGVSAHGSGPGCPAQGDADRGPGQGATCHPDAKPTNAPFDAASPAHEIAAAAAGAVAGRGTAKTETSEPPLRIHLGRSAPPYRAADAEHRQALPL